MKIKIQFLGLTGEFANVDWHNSYPGGIVHGENVRKPGSELIITLGEGSTHINITSQTFTKEFNRINEQISDLENRKLNLTQLLKGDS